MQKILLAISLYLVSNAAAIAQIQFPRDIDGKIHYTETVLLEHVRSSDAIYKAVKEYFSVNINNFQRNNNEKNFENSLIGITKKNITELENYYRVISPITYDSQEEGKIIARVVNRYYDQPTNVLVYFEYDLIIRIKDAKYKYEVSNFYYTHYLNNVILKPNYFGLEFQKILAYLDSDIKTMINGMKRFINNYEKQNNDW